MKKFLLGFVLAVLATTSYAATIDVSKLTEAQRLELATQAEKMARAPVQPAAISAEVRKEAEAWGQLGQNLGVALIAAAKELGVAANEFAATPLGMVVSAVVIYKIIGEAVLGIIFGVIVLVTGTLLVLYFNRRLCYTMEFDYKPTLFGLYNKKVVTKREPVESGESYFLGWVLTIIGLGVVWTLGLNLIF